MLRLKRYACQVSVLALANMTLDGNSDAWELEDAELRQRNAPDLYVIPSSTERAHIQIGSHVQLLFLFRSHYRHGPFLQSERLWATVCDVNNNGFCGTLKSGPTCSNVLRPGDTISFQSRHIAAVR